MVSVTADHATSEPAAGSPPGPLPDHLEPIPSPSGGQALAIVLRGACGLAVVAALELVVSILGGSAAVLADGLHNAGDVASTAALAAAFALSRRAPTRRFPYGYHRIEDLAGLVVLGLVVAGAVVAGTGSVERLVHRQPLGTPAASLAAALLGVVGNEAVARYKLLWGRRLNSVALVADARHGRVDALVSLGAAVGVVGSWAGIGLLDPLAGLAITLVIVAVAVDVARNVAPRLLDEADASLLATIEDVAATVPGVVAVRQVRTRWTGRRLRAELVLAVPASETVGRAHALGEAVRHALFHRVAALADVVVHLDPAEDQHAHDVTAHHDEQSP